MKKILFIFIFVNLIKLNVYAKDIIPDILLETISKYPETKILEQYYKEYLKDPHYNQKPIDLNLDLTTDDVPLFIQWDKRWAFCNYGKTTYLATAGCAPTCFAMVYDYFYKSDAKTPKDIAKYSYDKKYYIEAVGTKFELFTEGFKDFGLTATKININLENIKSYIDNGSIIIAYVKQGHFTKGGHFIIIKNYDKNNYFYINDPNSLINSKKNWTSTIILKESKLMWAIKN